MNTRGISLSWALSASLFMSTFALPASSAQPEQNLQFRRTPPAVLGNGCSIHDVTDGAYQAASPNQRRVMDGARANLDAATRQFAQDRQAQAAIAAPLEITIPVVVHVVHDNGPENISDARIIDRKSVV